MPRNPISARTTRTQLKAATPVVNKSIFSKVQIARELLREKAEEILTEYLDVVSKAKDSGDYKTAAESLQWLMEHMPASEAGERILDTGVDKQHKIEASKTPIPVQIGIMVGGVASTQKALPKPKDKPKPQLEVIDAE
jgi:hypothetical protein